VLINFTRIKTTFYDEAVKNDCTIDKNSLGNKEKDKKIVWNITILSPYRTLSDFIIFVIF